jgi:hypothetical protein
VLQLFFEAFQLQLAEFKYQYTYYRELGFLAAATQTTSLDIMKTEPKPQKGGVSIHHMSTSLEIMEGGVGRYLRWGLVWRP